MTRSKLAISNAIAIWLCQLLGIGPQLVVVPYLLSTLGESGFGLYALIWSLITAIDRFERSLQSGVVKYGAEYLAKNDTGAIDRLLSSGICYAVILGTLATTTILLALSLTGHLIPGLRLKVYVVAGTVFLISPLAPFLALIHSRQHYYISATADLLSRYIAIGTIIGLFLCFTPSPAIAVIAMSTSLIVSRFAQLPFAYLLIPGLTRRPSNLDWMTLRAIISFGSVTVLLAICGVANTAGMKWLISAMVSTTFVAHLGILLMPSLLLSRFSSALTVTLMPASSGCQASSDLPAIRRLFLSGVRYGTFFMLSANLLAIPLTRTILKAWVGNEYSFLAPFAISLLLTHSFFLTTAPAHHIMKGLGRLREIVLIQFAALILTPFVVYVIFHNLGMNPYVSVTAGLASGHCVGGCLNLIWGARATGVELTRLIGPAYLKILSPALLFSIPLWLLAYQEAANPWATIIITLCSVILFNSWCLFIVASPEERHLLRHAALSVGSQIDRIAHLVFSHLNTRRKETEPVTNDSYSR